MLDLNHPMTRWTFAASREKDAVLSLAKLMTLLPTAQRQQVFKRLRRHIQRLQRLNEKYFENSPFIIRALEDLEAGCKTIAGFECTESRLDGEGSCPICRSAISDS